MLQRLLIVPLICLFYGCATTPPIPTPSGKPEIVFSNVTKNEVANRIIDGSSSDGWVLKNSSEYIVVLEKPITSGFAKFVYGSKWNETPNVRLQCQLTEVQDGVRVLFNIFIVTNPGTAHEIITDISKGKDAYNLYSQLESLKAKISSKETKPQSNVQEDKSSNLKEPIRTPLGKTGDQEWKREINELRRTINQTPYEK